MFLAFNSLFNRKGIVFLIKLKTLYKFKPQYVKYFFYPTPSQEQKEIYEESKC